MQFQCYCFLELLLHLLLNVYKISVHCVFHAIIVGLKYQRHWFHQNHRLFYMAIRKSVMQNSVYELCDLVLVTLIFDLIYFVWHKLISALHTISVIYYYHYYTVIPRADGSIPTPCPGKKTSSFSTISLAFLDRFL